MMMCSTIEENDKNINKSIKENPVNHQNNLHSSIPIFMMIINDP